MAIREKLKAKFSRSKTDVTTPPRSTRSYTLAPGETHYTGRTDIEYYKPNEIPKSKYGRGQVDQVHKDMLNAYTFGGSFPTVRRKASTALSGTFSPGGTQSRSVAPSAAVSRRASWVSSRNDSNYSGSTNTAATSVPSVISLDQDHNKDVGSIKPSADEIEDIDNEDLNDPNMPIIRLDRQATANIPFSAEELERAMSKVAFSSRRSIIAVS